MFSKGVIDTKMHTQIMEYCSTIKMNAVSWRYGLEVKNTCYSFVGLGFDSWALHGYSQPHVIHFQGIHYIHLASTGNRHKEGA